MEVNSVIMLLGIAIIILLVWGYYKAKAIKREEQVTNGDSSEEVEEGDEDEEDLEGKESIDRRIKENKKYIAHYFDEEENEGLVDDEYFVNYLYSKGYKLILVEGKTFYFERIEK